MKLWRALALTVLVASASHLWAHTVTDMEGHQVNLGSPANRIYGATPADQLLLHAVDPALIVARSAAFKADGVRYLDAALQAKPLMGPFVNGALANIEAVV